MKMMFHSLVGQSLTSHVVSLESCVVSMVLNSLHLLVLPLDNTYRPLAAVVISSCKRVCCDTLSTTKLYRDLIPICVRQFKVYRLLVRVLTSGAPSRVFASGSRHDPVLCLLESLSLQGNLFPFRFCNQCW